MRPLFTPEKERALTQEYLSGSATLKQIAEREGCDMTTFHKIVKRNATSEEIAVARSHNHSKAKTGIARSPETVDKIRKANSKPPVYRNCLTCGHRFKIRPYKENTNGGHYCRPECYHSSLVGHEPANKIGLKVACAGCGTAFAAKPARVTDGRDKYCSKACADTHTPRKTGEAHPNWKGGVTTETLKIRNSTKYAQWRTAVFQRDEYTCQQCGTKGVYLEAHHKEPFAARPDLRFDVDNGVTLCVPCHASIDPHRSRFVPKRRRKPTESPAKTR